MKRFWSVLLACILVLCSAALPISAAELPSNPPPISRVSGRLNFSIYANELVYLGDDFSLAAGDIIKYDCTYTPKSASLDFGYVGPDGVFHYVNRTNGSISQSFEVNQSGMYTLAVRSNASYTVTVTGTVKY